MIYLYWYLGVGAVILILVAAFHNITKQKDGNSLNDVLTDPQPKRRELRLRLLDDVFGPALIGLLVVPFWPVILFFKIKQLIFGTPEIKPFEEPQFSVTRADLLTKMSISDIEEKEMVVDPLGAVPHLPFGHLNCAWNNFLEDVQPSDAIWTFSAKWTHWGRTELRKGYVIVNDGEVGHHFMTMRIDIDVHQEL